MKKTFIFAAVIAVASMFASCEKEPTALELDNLNSKLTVAGFVTMRTWKEKDDMLQFDRIITLNAVWQGKLPAKHPWVSPVFGNFSGIDNLHVFFGSDEILQPDDLFLKEVYEKAGKVGNFREYEGMFHTFPMFPIPQGFQAVREISNIIKKR